MSELRDVLAEEREKLLAPISAAQPTGESLRYEGTYDRIGEVRREEDATLPQGEWVRSLKQADWKATRSLCGAALSTKSKDLQIAAWLTEALLVLAGTAGARAGLRLIAELSDRYWPDLHPGTGDDDEPRIVALEWLDEKLAARIKSLKISEPAGDAKAYLYHEWEQVGFVENLTKAGKISADIQVADHQITRSKIEASWLQTPASFFERETRELDALIAETESLAASLDRLAGREAPSLRRIRKHASEVKTALAQSNRMPEKPAPAADAETAADQAAVTSPTPEDAATPLAGITSGTITSRVDAYRRLQQVADYLLRTEPHSPSGYLVRRAVRWGNADLATVLRELSADTGNIDSMLNILGIDTKEITSHKKS